MMSQLSAQGVKLVLPSLLKVIDIAYNYEWQHLCVQIQVHKIWYIYTTVYITDTHFLCNNIYIL
jgi:hypothetical protein